MEKAIYFASDFHLGAPNYEESRMREDRVVRWLNNIKANTEELFLVGDIFDFWFEYKQAIPKGYTRLLGKIAEFCDAGIPVHIFIGNHDMWMFDYLETELGVNIHRTSIIREFQGKRLFIGHGDGLGPGDQGYKFIKKVFANKVCQWLFARIHPNLGIGIAQYWSRKSRLVNGESDNDFLGDENEWLALYAKRQLEKQAVDYFIFGHRHLPLDIQLTPESKYINLGDWISYNTYAVLQDGQLLLKEFKG